FMFSLSTCNIGRQADMRGHSFDQFLWCITDDKTLQGLWLQKAFDAHLMQASQKGLIVAIDIKQTDGLVMPADLLPGQHFENFFQRSQAAGLGDEPVSCGEHGLFSLMHGCDFTQLGQALMSVLSL